MTESLGDAPIQREFQEMMNELATVLDQILNSNKRGAERENGFIVMVFPFAQVLEGDLRVNYISNAQREDVINLLRNQLLHFETDRVADEASRSGETEEE